MTHDEASWRKSSFSGSGANCVEVAPVEGVVLVRNSNRVEAGHLSFDALGLASFVAACKSGEFDGLV